MAQKTILQVLAIAFAIIVIALLLLPGIAGLIEGDYNYVRWELNRGWEKQNNWNNENYTMTSALSDVYVWSLWRIGLREQAPTSYQLYQIIQTLKPMSIR